jgi:hypothetical protein
MLLHAYMWSNVLLGFGHMRLCYKCHSRMHTYSVRIPFDMMMQVPNCRCCPGCLGTLRSASAASNYLFVEEQNLLLARPGTLMAGPMNGVAPACFTCGAGQIF